MVSAWRTGFDGRPAASALFSVGGSGSGLLRQAEPARAINPVRAVADARRRSCEIFGWVLVRPVIEFDFFTMGLFP